jgi:hypothetical protein
VQRNSHPVKWPIKGCSDSLDGSDTFPGAMSSLQNLLPDPTTSGVWQPRPAAISLTTFGSFTTPGFISLLNIVGNFAYGMIASGRNAGKDEPFCYNLLTASFVTISGVTNANTPTSPPSTGAWTPPTSDVIGSKLIVTHPGFTGAGGVFFGVMDISNPAAPAWSGNNLTGAIAFTVPPTAVKQFNGRAYYIQNVISQPAVIFSDSLNPTVATNANQILTFGDNVQLTALGALPLQNQLGGIIQGLMVFKGVKNVYQITGDSASTSSPLTLNSLNTATGTLAPLTVCQTPKGVAFVSPDGVRLIDQFARISDPIGIDGQGVTVPFIYSNVPSRMVAACNGTVLRVTTQNANVPGTPQQEWWYDLARQKWHGPHTFPASQISAFNNTFVMAGVGINAKLWQSDSVVSVTSTYVENGNQMSWLAQTVLLPDMEQITFNCMTESTWDLGLSSAVPNILASVISKFMQQLDSVVITSSSTPTIWGAFTWGAALWSGAINALSARQMAWHKPIVFDRIFMQVTGQSATGIKVGSVRLRYQILRQFYNQAFDVVS